MENQQHNGFPLHALAELSKVEADYLRHAEVKLLQLVRTWHAIEVEGLTPRARLGLELSLLLKLAIMLGRDGLGLTDGDAFARLVREIWSKEAPDGRSAGRQ